MSNCGWKLISYDCNVAAPQSGHHLPKQRVEILRKLAKNIYKFSVIDDTDKLPGD